MTKAFIHRLLFLKNHRFISLLVCLFVIPSWAVACSYAYQYSLFPLGSHEEQIMLLELELERYVSTQGDLLFDPMNPANNKGPSVRWKGTLKIKSRSFSKEGLDLFQELAYIDIDDSQYYESLQPYFEKALMLVTELENFQEAVFIKAGYCRYDRSCTFMQLKLDTTTPPSLNLGLSAHSKFQEVLFPAMILKKFENITKLHFTEIETVDAESRVDFYKAWKPYSARIYQIGQQELVVYSLGWGQQRGYFGKKDLEWNVTATDIEKIIEGNDVLLHGQRFDILQLMH